MEKFYKRKIVINKEQNLQRLDQALAKLSDLTRSQIKILINTADTSLDSSNGTATITITPTNMRGATSVTLNNIGGSAMLMFKNSKWNIIGGNGYDKVI